ncbi:Fatty acyl-AMP ligase FadD28 and polyketide synthase [Mycobacterium tuberculosis]|nr:Fatty acyl-AMP ligase FadD28 and polyketide synthase [Mycobacterium tuberculosis]
MVGGRLNGKMSMSVVGYRPGGSNTKQDLRELVARTLAEFGVTGKID